MVSILLGESGFVKFGLFISFSRFCAQGITMIRTLVYCLMAIATSLLCTNIKGNVFVSPLNFAHQKQF